MRAVIYARVSTTDKQDPEMQVREITEFCERRGWIKARWGPSENNRHAKYYELTRAGRKQLESETNSWRKLSAAVGQILDTA